MVSFNLKLLNLFDHTVKLSRLWQLSKKNIQKQNVQNLDFNDSRTASP